MKLQIETIADLETLDNGSLKTLFASELTAALDDLRVRPAVKKARKIQIELCLAPVADANGTLSAVNFAANIKKQVPAAHTNTYQGAPTATGLHFDDLSPDDAAQMTIDDLKPQKSAKR